MLQPQRSGTNKEPPTLISRTLFPLTHHHRSFYSTTAVAVVCHVGNTRHTSHNITTIIIRVVCIASKYKDDSVVLRRFLLLLFGKSLTDSSSRAFISPHHSQGTDFQLVKVDSDLRRMHYQIGSSSSITSQDRCQASVSASCAGHLYQNGRCCAVRTLKTESFNNAASSV